MSSRQPVSQGGSRQPLSQGGSHQPVSQGGSRLPVSQGGSRRSSSSSTNPAKTSTPPARSTEASVIKQYGGAWKMALQFGLNPYNTEDMAETHAIARAFADADNAQAADE